MTSTREQLAEVTKRLVANAEGRGAIFVTVALGALGFLPLFGPPGYEQSIAAGLVLPSSIAIAVALTTRALRQRTPTAQLLHGCLYGGKLALLAWVLALLQGLRVGFCDLLGGTIHFALTAAIGAVLAGAWGAIAGEMARDRKKYLAVLLALAAPIGCIAVSVGRFYSSPMIFAFDPFVGFFSGTLYDTVIEATDSLLSYRVGSLASLAAAFALASLLARRENGHLQLARPLARDGRYLKIAALVACAAVSLGITAAGASLGHWQTVATITSALAGTRVGPRCTVVYPAGVQPPEIDLLVRDCEEELAADERALGIRGPDRVTAFFFRDVAEKRHLMGAAETYIAKPWRHEVYLQMANYPHPVLGHEMAHVVSGSFGRGPFRIAGSFGGLWPNPGLIEGVAVAASPSEDELTDAEWSRAMLDLGILPSMDRLFSFGFLGDSSAKSYTVAGAFVRWLIDTKGAPAVRNWYSGAKVEDATGSSLADLDLAFRTYLQSYEVTPTVLAYAKAKFARPSVFGRKCPHEVDALRRKADRCRDDAEYDRADHLYEEVLRDDPHDWSATQSRAAMDARYSAPERGKSWLTAIEDDKDAPATWRERAGESLADQLWLDGAGARAAEKYAALAASALDEDRGRTLDVKALAAGDPAKVSVRELLVGSPGRPVEPVVAATELGQAWSAKPDMLVAYLLGKGYIAKNRYSEASSYFDGVVSNLSDDPLPIRIQREAWREKAVLACVFSDKYAKEQLVKDIDDERSPFRAHHGGRYDSIRRLLQRCQ